MTPLSVFFLSCWLCLWRLV